MAISYVGEGVPGRLERLRSRKPTAEASSVSPPPRRPFPVTAWTSRALSRASRGRLVSQGAPMSLSPRAREDTLEWALRPALIVGQVLGFLSCSGGPHPRFRWLSLRTLYFLVSAASFVAMSVLLVLIPEEDPSTSAKFVNGIKGTIVHTASTLVVLVLFLRLSQRWQRLTSCFQRVEQRLAAEGFASVNFGSYIRRVTGVFTVVTFLVEMVVDAVPVVGAMMEDPELKGIGDTVERFFYESFPQMRQIPVYNSAIVFWVVWSKAQAKFAITYTDLVLWAGGTAAAAQFKSINKKLGELNYEAMSEMDWRRVRESYNDVFRLIWDLDRILGPQVLLSYAIGLWFVCSGILLLVDSEIDTLKRVYIFLSTAFWVLRIIFSTLSLASVREENVSIRNSLHLVPTTAYGDEVHRFAMQACHDDLGFTGMRFFTVTRSILLTLAGTIASYEIVLMEFNR